MAHCGNVVKFNLAKVLHLRPRSSPVGYYFTVTLKRAKTSKRELDKSCSSLLPCGAKPSALMGYIRNRL